VRDRLLTHCVVSCAGRTNVLRICSVVMIVHFQYSKQSSIRNSKFSSPPSFLQREAALARAEEVKKKANAMSIPHSKLATGRMNDYDDDLGEVIMKEGDLESDSDRDSDIGEVIEEQVSEASGPGSRGVEAVPLLNDDDGDLDKKSDKSRSRSGSPNRKSVSPSRKSSSPMRKTKSLSPMRKSPSPKRKSTSPMRKSPSPKRQASPKRQTSPQRTASPKSKLSPKQKSRSPSPSKKARSFFSEEESGEDNEEEEEEEDAEIDDIFKASETGAKREVGTKLQKKGIAQKAKKSFFSEDSESDEEAKVPGKKVNHNFDESPKSLDTKPKEKGPSASLDIKKLKKLQKMKALLAAQEKGGSGSAGSSKGKETIEKGKFQKKKIIDTGGNTGGNVMKTGGKKKKKKKK
jgi:hypothetical protein